MDILFSIINESWSLTLKMAPYLLLGFIAAGLLHVFVPIDIFGRYLGNESTSSVFKASLLGVPIPLCSCGVLPVAASIRKAGASRSAILSFLITTPVTGVDSLLATWALLGWTFTLFRLFTSIIIGFVAGFIMIFFEKKDHNKIINEMDTSFNDSGCCNDKGFSTDNSAKGAESIILIKIKEVIHYAFYELPVSFSGSLFLGLILAGIISFLLPPEMMKMHFGVGILGIAVATLIAIPLYVCSTGSIPIAAALIVSGFSPGAALAFLIAGPATNTIAILTVKKILGKRAILIYIITIFMGGFGFGLLLDFFKIEWLTVSITDHLDHGHSLFEIICATILLALIIPLYIRDRYMNFFSKSKRDESMNSIILSSPNISCQHCAGNIKKTLSQFNEIEDIEIDINTKRVTITLKEDIDNDEILSAMEHAGYTSIIK